MRTYISPAQQRRNLSLSLSLSWEKKKEGRDACNCDITQYCTIKFFGTQGRPMPDATMKSSMS